MIEPEYFIDPDHPHLGGYKPGGDFYSHYPKMWTWLRDLFHIQSVLDVGCGEGHSLDFFETLGCTAVGIDGIPQPDARIIQHDYTLGPYVPDREFDLVWSCEFVEHVEEKFIPNFLETFKAGDMLLMTAAFPGQGGYHHVNCQDEQYWIDVMADINFRFDQELTRITRSMTDVSYYYYTGLAFRRAL